MALLPKKLRHQLFDTLSLQTMRYVSSVPLNRADGALKAMYEQINRDFFINGSLTSRSRVLDVFAAIWILGRETILVDDLVDRTTKEAIAATLSSINDCPYCGEMLVSLVHAGNRSDDAMRILDQEEDQIEDPILRARLAWIRTAATSSAPLPAAPFTAAQLPEVIGSIMAMSDINRFSHIVMAGSPVQVPYGSRTLKKSALRLFGNELRPNHSAPLAKGASLVFLPDATLPTDLAWVGANPRIASAVARWAATVERESKTVVAESVKRLVNDNLARWDGSQMPLGRSWVDSETGGLRGTDRDIARFALMLAKASYLIDTEMNEALLALAGDEENFIRILAWCSYSAARYLGNRIAAAAVATPQQRLAA